MSTARPFRRGSRFGDGYQSVASWLSGAAVIRLINTQLRHAPLYTRHPRLRKENGPSWLLAGSVAPGTFGIRPTDVQITCHLFGIAAARRVGQVAIDRVILIVWDRVVEDDVGDENGTAEQQDVIWCELCSNGIHSFFS